MLEAKVGNEYLTCIEHRIHKNEVVQRFCKANNDHGFPIFSSTRHSEQDEELTKQGQEGLCKLQKTEYESPCRRGSYRYAGLVYSERKLEYRVSTGNRVCCTHHWPHHSSPVDPNNELGFHVSDSSVARLAVDKPHL